MDQGAKDGGSRASTCPDLESGGLERKKNRARTEVRGRIKHRDGLTSSCKGQWPRGRTTSIKSGKLH